MLLQVADALAAAHELAIVHRDVKPSNILIALDGKAKLSDFGIARAVADASLTQTGLVTGSPAYIAPEVATGAPATTASDVWSFGATIYHALAGSPPYEATGGENAVLGVLYRVAHEPPPRLRGDGWLAPLLEVTMDHEPDNRLSMDDVAAYLHAGPQGASITPPAGLGTQVLPQVAAAPSGPPAASDDNPTSTAISAPAATSTGTSASASAPSRPSRRRIALGAAAAVIVLAVIGSLLLLGGGDDPGQDAASLPNTTTDPNADPGSETGDSTTDTVPSAEDLESFASSYVSTAADDPDAGFALLTQDYQARSPEYADFWGSVSNPEILEVTADPDDLTVTYTYKYDFPGSGNQTERVTLFLVQDGDRLLIDNAVSG